MENELVARNGWYAVLTHGRRKTQLGPFRSPWETFQRIPNVEVVSFYKDSRRVITIKRRQNTNR